MKYLLKISLIPFVYLIFMLILSFMVMLIPEHLMWLRYVGAAACLGVYVYIVFGVSYREGETALKVRVSNDIERRVIIETGEDRPLKKDKEYKAWKGFVAGLIVCTPLIIMMIIHTILIFAVGQEYTGAGMVAGLLYFLVYMFFRIPGTTITAFTYYYALLALPLIVLLMGFSYMYGAKRIAVQQEAIKQTEDSIYGEKDGEKSENNKR